MSYVVNAGEDIHCDKCKKNIDLEEGFFRQLDWVLCPGCRQMFQEYVKERYQEFINL